MQGRLKIVSNKFREPGNTDEEIKKMETKRKRSEKKELKAQKAQAQALNTAYLINEMTLHASSTHIEDIFNAEKHIITGEV